MPTIRDGYYRFFLKKHKMARNSGDVEKIEPLCIAGKCESESVSHSVVSNCLRPHGL